MVNKMCKKSAINDFFYGESDFKVVEKEVFFVYLYISHVSFSSLKKDRIFTKHIDGMFYREDAHLVLSGEFSEVDFFVGVIEEVLKKLPC